MIDDKTVKDVAFLARLKIEDAEVQKLAGEMQNIIEYIDQLVEVDISGIKETVHAQPLQNVLRDDVEKPSFSRSEALKNAPAQIEGLLKVPVILDDKTDK